MIPDIENAPEALSTVCIDMVTKLRIVMDALPAIIFDAAHGDDGEGNPEVLAWLCGFMLRLSPVLDESSEQMRLLIEKSKEFGFWDDNSDSLYDMETDVLRDLRSIDTTDEPPLD